MVLGAAPAIANGLITGVDNIPPILLRAGSGARCERLALYRHVVLPASLPSFIGGLKQGWAFAWRSLMAGELLVIIADAAVDRLPAAARPRPDRCDGPDLGDDPDPDHRHRRRLVVLRDHGAPDPQALRPRRRRHRLAGSSVNWLRRRVRGRRWRRVRARCPRPRAGTSRRSPGCAAVGSRPSI